MRHEIEATNCMDVSRIRNFCVIAHIDHGKSTLADRFLDLAGSVKLKKGQKCLMDTLEIEQERGITVKLQSARLEWKGHIVNLIDTPGHVDFSFEVSRSIFASEGALLLVDAKQGIQAQTISNARLASEQDLEIIPVITKIDLPNVNIEQRKEEINKMLGFKSSDIFLASGKTGQGVSELLDAITMFVPSPEKKMHKVGNEMQAIVFDSTYSEHKGVILFVRLFSGKISKGSKLLISGTENYFSPNEVGYMTPFFQECDSLEGGEVGYICTGVKDCKFINVGQTIVYQKDVTPLYVYRKPVPRIFATIFPLAAQDYNQLSRSIARLQINDPAIEVSDQRSEVLGAGFKIGFLGLLHMDVFQERLEREFGSSLIVTSPTVRYKAKLKSGDLFEIETPSDYPDITTVDYFEEPYVAMHILAPVEYMSVIMDMCQNHRATYIETESNENLYSINYMNLHFEMPLAEVISGFFDKLKAVSRGYASMDYSEIGYRPVNLVKVSILVNKKEVAALSFLEVKSKAASKAVGFLKILKKAIPRHQFEVPLQATIGAKIVARENIKSYRKDVLQKLHASDPSRRMKLLNRQKKGKARMKEIGNVSIPQDAFLGILKV